MERQQLRALLTAAPDTELVGEATTGDEATSLAAELQPDVILMDIKMPGVNGVEATQRIVQGHPEISILLVTMLEEDDAVFAAMRAGARGCLVKGADQDEVLRAIRAVASGEAIFGQAVAQRLIHFFSSPRETAGLKAFPDLTEREAEVLLLMSEGRQSVDNQCEESRGGRHA